MLNRPGSGSGSRQPESSADGAFEVSLERLSKVALEATPFAIALTSLSGHLLFANQSFCRDIAGAETLPADIDIAQACEGRINLAFMETLARDGVPRSLEIHVRHPKGDTSYICHAVRVTDDHGTPAYLLLIFLSSTMQPAVRPSQGAEEGLRTDALEQTAGYGIWSMQVRDLHNLVDNPVQWSSGIWSLLKQRQALLDATPRNYLRFVHPEDRTKLLNAVRATIEKEPFQRVRYRLVGRDSSERYMQSMSLAVADPSQPGQIVIHGIECDITSQVKDEQEGHLARVMLGAILESEGFPIFVVDRRLRYLFFNSAYKHFLAEHDLPPAQAGGECLVSLRDTARRRAVGLLLGQALSGETRAEEVVHVSSAGRRSWYDVTYLPVRDESTKMVVGVLVMARDITAVRQRQEPP